MRILILDPEDPEHAFHYEAPVDQLQTAEQRLAAFCNMVGGEVSRADEPLANFKSLGLDKAFTCLAIAQQVGLEVEKWASDMKHEANWIAVVLFGRRTRKPKIFFVPKGDVEFP